MRLPDVEMRRGLTPYIASSACTETGALLDIGLGNTVGARWLSNFSARPVVSLDIDPRKARYAQSTGLKVVVGDAQLLSFADESFGLVTCFEVIEHVAAPRQLLAEVRRVVSPSGIVLVTTPNRRGRVFPFHAPPNPEHVQEFSAKKFVSLCRDEFDHASLIGIHGRYGYHRYYRRLWRRAELASVVPKRFVRLVSERRSIPLSEESSPLGATWSLEESEMVALNTVQWSQWPFYCDPEPKGSLNFLVVCGSSAQVVDQTSADLCRQFIDL
jgi:SAM-dependent methyltransferase